MHATYQSILQQTLVDRTRANPGYSMRAFARDIGLAPSTLSEVLKGRKGLSPKKSARVSVALRLPQWQTTYFQDLVARHHARSRSEKKAAVGRLEARASETAVQNLKSETARALTSWLSLALLEATYLKDFQPNESYLAKKFSVSVEEICETRDRLLEVKLLEIDEKGSWSDLSPFFATPDGPSSETVRGYHRSVLRLAESKIETDAVADRILKSVVCAIGDEQLPEARRIVDDAIAAMMNLAARNEGKKDHVMCLGTQLFFLAKGIQ